MPNYTIHPTTDTHGRTRHQIHRNGQPMGDLFTTTTREAAQTIIINLLANDTAAATEDAPRPGNTTGWSKASRRRTSRRSHPLGEAIEAGDGYTTYEDTAFGGGRVQIWDES